MWPGWIGCRATNGGRQRRRSANLLLFLFFATQFCFKTKAVL
ncbi:hypothetical protein L150_05402 [Candida albicans Ca529L]|nr:hypothetical protein L150_05402 [Candida albicans Ca529L]